MRQRARRSRWVCAEKHRKKGYAHGKPTKRRGWNGWMEAYRALHAHARRYHGIRERDGRGVVGWVREA